MLCNFAIYIDFFCCTVSPNDTAMLSVITSGVYQDNEIYVEHGQNFSINCSASGGPNNTHIWKHNGAIISGSDTDFSISYSISDTMSFSVLTVSTVVASIHKGSYHCEVINDAGDHFSQLTAYGKYIILHIILFMHSKQA